MKTNFSIVFQINHEDEFDMSRWAMEHYIKECIEIELKERLNMATHAKVEKIQCIITNSYQEVED